MAAISPDRVAERHFAGDDDLLVLDIRHPDEYEAWHIPDSVNVDVIDTLSEAPDEAAAALADLPPDKEIVTVCAAGGVSATATAVLHDLGYDAKTLEDGLRGWSRVHRSAPVPLDGDGELVQVARPGTGCLSYVVISDGAAAVVDPSQYTEVYDRVLDGHDATLEAVLETHAHADHVSGARDLAERASVPYHLHPADAGSLDVTTPIGDGDELRVGDVTVAAMHTPGHTAGSVTFAVADEALLTGDTVFLDGVGRPDLDGGGDAAVRRRAATLYDSIERILARPGHARVAPAHDPGVPDPPAVAPLHAVRQRNERLAAGRAAFVEAVTGRLPDAPPNHERIKRVNVGRESVPADEARQLELGPNRCAAG